MALEVTQQHQRLAVLLRESVRKRLLHPGANTHQIIDVYIATIKVLRVLDPKVCEEQGGMLVSWRSVASTSSKGSRLPLHEERLW